MRYNLDRGTKKEQEKALKDYQKKLVELSAYLERKELLASKLSNENLLAEALQAAAGDDYDGCFTKQGEIDLIVLYKELELRLVGIGFIKSFKLYNVSDDWY